MSTRDKLFFAAIGIAALYFMPAPTPAFLHGVMGVAAVAFFAMLVLRS